MFLASLESRNATEKLKRDHPYLFECLQVTITRLTTWSESDVHKNQNGGIQENDVNALPPEFGKIVGALKQPRWYKVRTLILQYSRR